MQSNQNTNNQRRLKVYGRSVNRGRKLKTVPEIRLMGNWLTQMGYVPGQTISVVLQDQSLTITSISSDS